LRGKGLNLSASLNSASSNTLCKAGFARSVPDDLARAGGAIEQAVKKYAWSCEIDKNGEPSRRFGNDAIGGYTERFRLTLLQLVT
jgi:hypothetical protein